MRKRAVITGIGLLTPLGNSPKTFYANALAGCSRVRRVTKFDTTGLPVRIGGEIDLDDEDPFTEEERAEMPTVARWAVLAAREAVRDAGLDLARENPYAIDVVLGNSISALEGLPPEVLAEGASGFRRSTIAAPVRLNPAAPAIQVGRDLGVLGEVTNITTACSSSTTAIGYAARLIQHGESGCVVTGGADEGVHEMFLAAFGSCSGLSLRNDDPEHASRPFDRDRDGPVFSDAACVLVVEEYGRARRRNARVYCELTGFGATSEASSAFRPCKSEASSARCVERALARAGRGPADFDYYCALGLGHPWLDIRETRMVNRVFGRHARRLASSSLKSMMGHPLGAAGGVQAAACALAIANGAVPPTINYAVPDPECDLDCVPNEARRVKVRNALVYTLGNGGANAALVLSAC